MLTLRFIVLSIYRMIVKLIYIYIYIYEYIFNTADMGINEIRAYENDMHKATNEKVGLSDQPPETI